MDSYKLRSTQRTMEWSVKDISLNNIKQKECIKRRTKVTDIVKKITHQKGDHAGPVTSTVTDSRRYSRIIG